MKPLEQLDAENHSHESREEVAFYVRVKARYVEIEYWYERLFASHDIGDFERDMLPDTYDGARLWASLAAGDINNARRSIDSIFPFGSTDEILGHLKKYKEEVQQSLAALVPKQVAKALLPATVPKRRGNQQKQECPGDMLERASVFFSCTSCGERALPWSKVNVHWHERHPDIHFFDDGGWPRKKLHVRFWEEGHQTVQKILAVLRFGSQTSAAHLDSLVKSGRLYCACGDPSLELPDELIWAKLVKHLHVHLEMNYAFKNTHLMVFKGRVVTWIDDHRLQDCIKCLPLHADTSTSSHRFSADAATRTRVERHLDKIVNPVCAVCRALAADVTTPSELATIAQSCLSRNADAIVYHLKAKHGRDFREEDVTSKSS
ncbi:hypothetical protein L226DRAFT_536838 [Lentinus tigrinus ALCF2SS1-7]|nr:hypothetical protein L226DRAFT_536838 [Lentinus tigrinus ALCF2SS1-7]